MRLTVSRVFPLAQTSCVHSAVNDRRKIATHKPHEVRHQNCHRFINQAEKRNASEWDSQSQEKLDESSTNLLYFQPGGFVIEQDDCWIF